ncbi:MAG: VPLPA-CTERM sorting domain-containing protein [Pseudomonadota bacterium]
MNAMMNAVRGAVFAGVAVAATAWSAQPAQALFATLEIGGEFGAGALLGNQVVQQLTGLEFEATAFFDTDLALPFDTDTILFPAFLIVVDIESIGTVESVFAPDAFVALFAGQTDRAAGLVSPGVTEGFLGTYADSTPLLDVNAPASSLLSGLLEINQEGGFIISTDAGALNFGTVASLSDTARLTVGEVPLPAAGLLLIGGLGGLTLLRRRAKA